MKEPRDLETELWGVFDALGTVSTDDEARKEELDIVDRRLKAIDLILETRKAGERANPRDQSKGGDPSLTAARARANGARA